MMMQSTDQSERADAARDTNLIGRKVARVTNAEEAPATAAFAARSAASGAPTARSHRPKQTGDLAKMKRMLRKAERRAGDGSPIGGTGATVLKFLGAPLCRLADRKRIGAEEIRAADDIAIAFHAQAGALMIKPPCLEKRDATYAGREPVYVIDAVSRYKRWARHWSTRARDGDRTLEIVIAAVIDERAFHVIENDVGIRHGGAARAVIAALRDYAARAGWTDRSTADAWIAAAATVFPLRRQRVQAS
jgi:hypothetical protein